MKSNSPKGEKVIKTIGELYIYFYLKMRKKIYIYGCVCVCVCLYICQDVLYFLNYKANINKITHYMSIIVLWPLSLYNCLGEKVWVVDKRITN